MAVVLHTPDVLNDGPLEAPGYQSYGLHLDLVPEDPRMALGESDCAVARSKEKPDWIEIVVAGIPDDGDDAAVAVDVAGSEVGAEKKVVAEKADALGYQNRALCLTKSRSMECEPSSWVESPPVTLKHSPKCFFSIDPPLNLSLLLVLDEEDAVAVVVG